jgi:uncharacterized protein YdhG (YjbR/CyaY superfamily)
MKPNKNVDVYIAGASIEVQAKLHQLRTAINKVAPQAQEKLSYGMPYYGYKGRLVYFRYSQNHIGLYIPPPVIANHAQELKGYSTSTATVRFPLDKPLPLALIKKLVTARIRLNKLSATLPSGT